MTEDINESIWETVSKIDECLHDLRVQLISKLMSSPEWERRPAYEIREHVSGLINEIKGKVQACRSI